MSKKLRLIGYDNWPSIALNRNCPDVEKQCTMPGVDIELAEMALNLAGIDFEIMRNISVTWHNVFDLIENGTADVNVLGMKMTLARMQKVDFSLPVSNYYQGYFIVESHSHPHRGLDYAIRPFHLTVWILLCFYLIFIYFYQKFLRNVASCVIIQSNSDTCGAGDGSAVRPFQPKQAPTICQISWMLATFFLLYTYKSKLRSFLTVPVKRVIPFETLSEVLDAVEWRGWKLVESPGGNDILKGSRVELLRYEKLIKMGKIVNISIDEWMLYETYRDHTLTCTGMIGDMFPNDINENHVFTPVNEKYVYIKDVSLMPDYLAYSFAKHLVKERQKFDNALVSILSAYTNMLRRYERTWTKYNPILRPRSHQMCMTDLWGAVHFMLIVYLFALISLLFETFYFSNIITFSIFKRLPFLSNYGTNGL